MGIIKQPPQIKKKKKQAKPEVKVNYGINLRKEIEEVLSQYPGEIFKIDLWFPKIENGKIKNDWISTSHNFSNEVSEYANRSRRLNVKETLAKLDFYYNKNNDNSIDGSFSILNNKKLYEFEFVGIHFWFNPKINNHQIKLRTVYDMVVETNKGKYRNYQSYKLIKTDNDGI